MTKGREKLEGVTLALGVALGVGLVVLSKPNYVTIMGKLGVVLIAPGLWLVLHAVVSLPFVGRRPKVERTIGRMKSEVRMVGISLHDVYEHGEKFRRIMKKVSERSEKSLKFKFLLLDPKSKFLKQREIEEEGKPTGRLAGECVTTLKKLESLKSLIPPDRVGSTEFEYGTYDVLPRYSIIWVDSVMFVGPYLLGKKGIDSIWLKAKKDKEDYEAYKRYFEDLWKRRKPLS